MRRELIANRALTRHAIHFGIFAIALDWLYTCCYWLILGRNDRRTKRHAELRYFGIIFQLAAELAAIVHLAGLRKKVQP